MGDYNRTVWKDHIKDQSGNVIQQGTPVSAKNLNNIENQIVILSAKENTLSELVKETVPSGFTTLSDLDYTYMASNPNTIRLSKDSVAYINGYKTIIPAGTVITLDIPPASGSREDLVFLECWKQADDNGSVTWNYRIRIVDGVDFNSYPEGILNTNVVKARGANTSDTTYVFTKASSDVGLYSSGSGSTTDKATLGTVDGYVYAVPMFRVRRRNSGGYAVNNGNGSDLFFKLSATFTWDASGTITGTLTQASSALKVGQRVSWLSQSSVYWRGTDANSTMIIKNISGNTFTMTFADNSVTGSLQATPLSGYVQLRTLRPDYVFADILDIRDVIDLRHQVSLTGFNYQQLLEENFDKLLRGELQTNAKTTMLKTYHGIPKTPIDSNHVFYASLDGTTAAEVGGPTGITGSSYKPMPTGLGYKFVGTLQPSIAVNGLSNATGTIDLIVPANDLKNDVLWATRVNLLDANDNIMLGVIYDVAGDRLYVYENYLDGTTVNTSSFPYKVGSSTVSYLQVRASWDTTNLYFRVNGKLIATFARKSSSNFYTPTKIRIGGSIGFANYTKSTLADLSISNIDRGSTFATLPQDFIDGYARIAPAFNTQRNVFSDAIMNEAPLATIHCAGNNNKEIALNVSSSAHWTSGDTVKITGLGGEIITGVIDSDTALAVITENNTNARTQIIVNDVSKLAVNDKIVIYNGVNFTGEYTINAIDAVNNIITLSGNTTCGLGCIITETTASSSSPLVKTNLNGTAASATSTTIVLPSTFSATDSTYNNLTITITGGTGAGQSRTISAYTGSTKTATLSSAWDTTLDTTSTFLITGVTVAGTWSNLGTNVVTFTLGALISALTSQDLYISYGLVETAGAGGIGEVLVTTLAGQSNGKNLVANPSVHIRDDFAGKTNGNTTVCPNIYSYMASNSLKSPSQFTADAYISDYSVISSLNGTVATGQNSTSGNISQQLFSLNLIRMVEDKFGPIPGQPDTASKVSWLKANISKITFNWWGYGVCPGGNKAVISGYRASNGLWNYFNYAVTTSTPSLIACGTTDTTIISTMIDTNGFVHFLAYTDASDGVTASSLYTDYANIEIALNTPAGYDVLAPENPRRDDGKSNLLLVRKETKEIQTMFTRANTDGIVTYGDYVPYQGGSFTAGQNMSIVSQGNNFMLSTSGTGKAYLCQNQDSLAYYNIEVNHNLPTMYSDYQFVNDNIVWGDLLYPIIQLPITIEKHIKKSKDGDAHTGYVQIPTWASNTLRGRGGLAYTNGSAYAEYSRFVLGTSAKNMLKAVMYTLVNASGVLKLLVTTSDISVGSKIAISSLSTWCAVDVFNIANRPLIK